MTGVVLKPYVSSGHSMPFRKEARLSHSLMFIPLWASLTSCLQAIVGRQVVRGSCNQVQPRPKGPVGVRGTPC